jgi:hypothetical protein
MSNKSREILIEFENPKAIEGNEIIEVKNIIKRKLPLQPLYSINKTEK